MGKIVEKKKRKKGRPSLIDLQKRNLKEQQIQIKSPNSISNPNPNFATTRRSTRRNPNPNSDDNDDNGGGGGDDDDVGCSVSNKKEKRLNLFLNSDDNNGDVDSGSKSDPFEVGPNKRKRKIDSISTGSGFESSPKDEKNSSLAKRANTQQGSKLDDGPSTTTPLPDNKLLLFILDRLKKKDTYGVFSEPVDPEELPDYHEVIQHPMDFSTVKKKVLDSAYANLEEFEKDVFLICSNAMQYNAPDTIYFRQARSIQELAKKDFENLRHESDDDNEPESGPKVARRGRPPLKNLFKRPPGRPPLERSNSTSHEPTPTTVGITNESNNDVRKGSPVTPVTEKQGPANSLAQSLYGSRHSEAYNGGSAEKYEKPEVTTGSASKWSLGKNWKKNNNIVFDETRRNTYKQTCASACRQEMSAMTTFHGERKLLIPVGFHTEYAYARSLSRFAAKLGPTAWKVASRKIERCLPSDIKFGPGWVTENDRPTQQKLPASKSVSGARPSAPTQGMIDQCGDKPVPKTEENSLPEASISESQSKLDDKSAKVPVPSPVRNNGPGSKLNSKAYQTHQSSQNQSRVNGLNGGYGVNFVTQMGKMIGATRPSVSSVQSNPGPSLSRTEAQNMDPPSSDSNDCGEAKILEKCNAIKSSGSLPNTGQSQTVSSGPPDLNVGILHPGSPGAGRTDSLHPDLALQL